MIYEYMIYRNNDNIVSLKPTKELDLNQEDYYSCEDTLYILYDFYDIDISDIEMSFVIAMDYKGHPIGIYRVSIGDYKSCNLYLRTIGIFILLTGARSFIVCHNHPNRTTDPSNEDVLNKMSISQLASLLDIEFEGSFIITREGYLEIDKKEFETWE